MKAMKTDNKLLNNFLLSFNSKGKSQNTITGYETDLIHFLKYIKKAKFKENTPIENIEIDNIDRDFMNKIDYIDLEFYMNHLTEENKAESSRARKVSSIKEFFKYLKKINVITNNPSLELETPKIPKRNPKFLNLQESKKAITNVDGKYKERDIAIITLFLNLGLRLSELVGIDITDIKDNSVRVIRKGNEEKFMHLNQVCITAINNYLAVRPEIKGEDVNALFISRNKRRITTQAVEDITAKYAGVNPHALRHSFSTNLLNTGKVNLRTLQELLNHKNLATTSIYTHVTNKEAVEALDLNPLNI
jgi:integrase/recombinase XerD